jgi:hypothetical protein
VIFVADTDVVSFSVVLFDSVFPTVSIGAI